ncbi:MAG TPA: hypothetical protein ENJ37_06090 [Deltaproteobacteria bacterium]|nr:hypothetical protein [Deltaproteobacteria bacterium]
MRRSPLAKLLVSLPLAALWLWPLSGRAMADVYAQADLNYQKSRTRSATLDTEQVRLVQGYTLGFSRDLTRTIRLAADVRLTVSDVDGDKSESLFPQLTLDFRPPSFYYFTMGFSRTETAPSEGDRLSTSILNASLVLPFEKWPSVSLTYNRSTMEDFAVPKKTDSVSSILGATADYNTTLLDTDVALSYSFNNTVTEDRVSDVETESPTHNVTANLARSFFRKALWVRGYAGYYTQETKSTSIGTPTRFEETASPDFGFYVPFDDTPAVTTLVDTGVVTELTDKNTSSSAGIDLDQPYRSIGLKFTLPQTIHKLYYYITTTDYTNFQNVFRNYGWYVYWSNDGTNWKAVTGLTINYDSAFKRLVFNFVETSAKYFKVVNTQVPLVSQTVSATEIEALRYILTTPKETITFGTDRDFGGFSLAFSPRSWFNIRYDLSFEHFRQDSNDLENTSVTHAVNSSLVVSPRYLVIQSGLSRNILDSSQRLAGTTTATSLETESSNYTLTLSSNPLDTLSSSLTFGRFDSKEDGVMISTNRNANLAANMVLYSGIDLTLTSTVTNIEEFRSDQTTDSVSHLYNLRLTPWETVTVIFNGGLISSSVHSKSGTRDSDLNSLEMMLSYTPTRKLYLSMVWTMEPTDAKIVTLAWLPTAAFQLNMRYGLTDTTTNAGLDLSWSPIRKLSVSVGYNRAETEDVSRSVVTKVDSFYARFSARFE